MNAFVRTALGMVVTSAVLYFGSTTTALAVDADAAKALAKSNDCFKCHAIDKTKKGPSYKKIAEKYNGKSDAEAKLIKHLTTSPKVKFPDGSEEDHKEINTKDLNEIKNLIGWILSQ